MGAVVAQLRARAVAGLRPSARPAHPTV